MSEILEVAAGLQPVVEDRSALITDEPDFLAGACPHCQHSEPVSMGYIWVTWQHPYRHRWPNAPTKLAWLRQLHRHLLHFKLRLEIFTSDRELEFFEVQDWLEQTFFRLTDGDIAPQDNIWLTEAMDEIVSATASMESIAYAIGHLALTKFGEREIVVEVSEDGENGGGFQWTPG